MLYFKEGMISVSHERRKLSPRSMPMMPDYLISRVAWQGVNEAVSACKGEVYVVTTKQQRFASALLEHAGENIRTTVGEVPL